MAILWRIALTEQANRDVAEIAVWTEEQFGTVQAQAYAGVLHTTIRELENGPDPVGVRRRDDILAGLRLVHVARRGRRGRHFVVFRVIQDTERTIEVLRILHDHMDLAHHIPPME